MIEALNFQARARTLDHLGREQIADVPTAISELWKNAYDAYATHVNLSLFDGIQPVVTISDDGHGMNYNEFVDRWLVVGTESKLFSDTTPKEDRFGLPFRPKQGQKGIGRLSSAHLGPLLLLISKRENEDYVVALLDWRVFENPYLLLSDIKIPVTKVAEKSEILDTLPQLFDRLMENVWGASSDKDRTSRIAHAWELYDKVEKKAYLAACKADEEEPNKDWKSPSEFIAETIISSSFDARHLSSWPVWEGEVAHGTAMLISELNDDFSSYLPKKETPTATDGYIKNRFQQTLTSFVDPYFDANDGPIKSKEVNGGIPKFSYSFDVVIGENRRSEVSDAQLIDRTIANEMEHVVFGTIDENGDFKGCVKSFGEWRKTNYDYVVPKPSDVRMPSRSNSRLGRCDIFMSTFELEVNSSSHDPTHHKSLKQTADAAGAFLIYRDGLRVLPYGREESDFFEIEMRRSKNAGRYFWQKRRMFGRLALSRQENPNLRDKAGREGFIDNITAKTLKQLMINILIETSDDYFGRNSDVRKTDLVRVKSKNKERLAQEKADKDAKVLKKKMKAEFSKKIKYANSKLPHMVGEISGFVKDFHVTDKNTFIVAQTKLGSYRRTFQELIWDNAVPTKLSRVVEKDYFLYSSLIDEVDELVDQFSLLLTDVAKNLKEDPKEILEKQVQRAISEVNERLEFWAQKVTELLCGEQQRFEVLRSERMRSVREKTSPLLSLVMEGRESLSVASKKIDLFLSEMNDENAVIFDGYLSSLENLKDSVDLQNIAMHGIYQSDDLRAEVERLNELAQLGIAVEILGHELQSYDTMIGSGIKLLPSDLAGSRALKSIETGYEGLTRQLRFLAPLQVSGRRSIHNITGQEIFDYVSEFFQELFARLDIRISASDAFLRFSVYDQPSRLFPVFINLINNSQYWLGTTSDVKREIRLDVFDKKIVVSDNGPGIDDIDVKRLFQLFFTRKSRGGRGVGLYLCRANLRMAGHDIEYVHDTKVMPLSGANFLIKFVNAEIE